MFIRNMMSFGSKTNRFTQTQRMFSTAFHQHPNYALASKKWPTSSEDCVWLVQFDLAGTLVDEYCIAPYHAFFELFSKRGFTLTPEQITGPMGLKKIEHIKHLLGEIREEWRNKFGQYPETQDVDHLNQEFNLLLQTSLPLYTALTPKADLALDFSIRHLHGYALTSGYPRPAANIAMSLLIKKYPPVAITTSDEAATRIAMVEENNRKCYLTRKHMKHVAFFTDAGSDIESLYSAEEYPWIIGISDASTHCGVTNLEAAREMTPALRLEKSTRATQILYAKGAHLVISNLSELPLALVAINDLIKQGFTPNKVKTFELPTTEFGLVPKKCFR